MFQRLRKPAGRKGGGGCAGGGVAGWRGGGVGAWSLPTGWHRLVPAHVWNRSCPCSLVSTVWCPQSPNWSKGLLSCPLRGRSTRGMWGALDDGGGGHLGVRPRMVLDQVGFQLGVAGGGRLQEQLVFLVGAELVGVPEHAGDGTHDLGTCGKLGLDRGPGEGHGLLVSLGCGGDVQIVRHGARLSSLDLTKAAPPSRRRAGPRSARRGEVEFGRRPRSPGPAGVSGPTRFAHAQMSGYTRVSTWNAPASARVNRLLLWVDTNGLAWSSPTRGCDSVLQSAS